MEPKLPDMIVYRDVEPRSTAVIFAYGFTGKAEYTWGLFPKLLMDDPDLADCGVFSWGYPTEPDLRNPVLRYFWTDNPDIGTTASGLRTQLDILRRQGDPPAGYTVRQLFTAIHLDF